MLRVGGITHWAIPVNDLDKAEEFYRDVMGFEQLGRLGASLSAFFAGGQGLVLCLEKEPIVKNWTREGSTHYAFTVSPEMWVQACKLIHQRKIEFDTIIYREKGTFTGRELYFFDPSGNRLELCDPTWKAGMPKPTFEEIVKS